MKVKEIWKDIEGYYGEYQVSSFGNIRRNGKVLKLANRKGYRLISLRKEGKSKTMQVHRLVAFAFIPNPHHLPHINHKDENPSNNHVENLEWCTAKYNANYGTRNKRIADKLKHHPNFYIPVLCYDLNNNFVKRYESAEEAGKAVGISGSGITACCRIGYNRTSAGGYKWKYEDSDIDISDIDYIQIKKKIQQFNLDGQLIDSYESKSDAARKLNKNIRNFSRAVDKGYAYGSLWIVSNNFDDIVELLDSLNEKQYHILQIDSHGVVINKYTSALYAAFELGLTHSNISNAAASKTADGKLFRKCGGYYWADIKTDPHYEIDFGHKPNHGAKAVIQYDINGNKLREFNSVADAQEYLGMDRQKISSIYDCFKKNSKKKIAYGYIWKRM